MDDQRYYRRRVTEEQIAAFGPTTRESGACILKWQVDTVTSCVA